MNMLAARWPGWQAVREEAEAERVASRLRLSHEKLRVTCQKVNKCLVEVEGEKVAMSLLTSYENNQLLAAIQSLGPGDLAPLQKWVHHYCRVRGLCGPNGRHHVSLVDHTIVSELLQMFEDILAKDPVYTAAERDKLTTEGLSCARLNDFSTHSLSANARGDPQRPLLLWLGEIDAEGFMNIYNALFEYERIHFEVMDTQIIPESIIYLGKRDYAKGLGFSNQKVFEEVSPRQNIIRATSCNWVLANLIGSVYNKISGDTLMRLLNALRDVVSYGKYYDIVCVT